MIFLLLCSRGVEVNLGLPSTCSKALIEIDSVPDDPKEQMSAIFYLLNDLQGRSVESAKGQADLVAGIKDINAGQNILEAQISSANHRLDTLEERTKGIDELEDTVAGVESTIANLEARVDPSQLRLNELEDQPRCNNIIFRRIPDSRD